MNPFELFVIFQMHDLFPRTHIPTYIFDSLRTRGAQGVQEFMLIPGIRQVQVVAVYLAPERDVVLRHVPAVVPEQCVHRIALESILRAGPRDPGFCGTRVFAMVWLRRDCAHVQHHKRHHELQRDRHDDV